jgi:adenylylsulfate kinase
MKQFGFTVWLTGLPSAGKSTLANHLQKELDELGLAVEVLDGDEVRQRLTNGLGFTKEDREENIRRIAYVAKLLTRVGAVAITAAISPYQESRKRARTEIGRVIEVYVQCPLSVCIQRDVKGLYAKAIKGEITNFTGISDPYDPPTNPDVVVHTDKESIEESLNKILDTLALLAYIPPRPAQAVSTNETGGHIRKSVAVTGILSGSSI